MRALLFLALVALPASAQVFPWSGDSNIQCGLDPTKDDTSRSYLSAAPYGSDGFACANGGCRFRLAPSWQAAEAYIYWNVVTQQIGTNGYWFVGDGAAVLTDNLLPKRSTQPVTVGGAHGLRLELQSDVGTCGSATQPEGVRIEVAGSGASSTRTCKCLKDTAGDFRWLNTDTATRGTTTTDCPVSP